MSGKTSFDIAEDRYRILLESTPLVPWEADARTWLFNYVGPQAVDLLGYPVENWYEANFWVDRVHPEDRDAAVSTCVRLSLEGDDYEFEYRMIRADGTTVWISDIVRVEMENGVPAVLRGFLIDVTERKEAEAALGRSITEQFLAEDEARRSRDELAHVLRVATVGELASSVVHELNQPLSAIAANSQAARRFLVAEQPDIEEAMDALADITSDAKRAGNVIRHMRDLLMNRQVQREPVDMNEVVSHVAGLLHSDAVSHHVMVTLDLGDELPTTPGDRTQLEQVILNLMVNAFEAMTSCEIDRRELVVRTFVGDAGSAEITVSDNGPGFQAGPDHIFEPFVTTKANGLGMGLSISRSIIDAHGGRLEVVHNPDGGATLRITLPAGGEDS